MAAIHSSLQLKGARQADTTWNSYIYIYIFFYSHSHFNEVLLGGDVTVWLQVQRSNFHRCPTVTQRFPAKSLLERGHFTWQEVFMEFQNYCR